MLWAERAVASPVPYQTRADANSRVNIQIQSPDCAHVSRFEVEIATEHAKKLQGLMYRKTMPQNAGMLFLWEKPTHLSMWMKNTYISLDLLFINTRGIITQIHERAIPLSQKYIRAKHPVVGVLEIVGGRARASGVSVGDHILHWRFDHPPPCEV